MSCSMMVLKNVTEDEYGAALMEPEDYEIFRARLQTADVRVAFAKSMRNDLEYDLMESYKGSIEYLKEYIPDVSLDSDTMILGIERPEKLREYVRNWNITNTNSCIRQFEYLEQLAEKEGIHTLSQFLASKIDENGVLEDIPYPASLYMLRKTLDAANGIFTYDSPSDLAWVTYKDENGVEQVCHSVIIDEEAKDFILEHPEQYALIEIVYD